MIFQSWRKHPRHRPTSLLVLLLAISMILGACGSTADTEDTADTAAGGTDETSAEAGTGDQVDLLVWVTRE
jgi:hypothetical protein